MTDIEICEQLAERVQGWKVPPDDSRENYHERQKFFGDKANYPSYDPAYELLWREENCDGVKWTPFSSWADAVKLVRSDRVDSQRLLDMVDAMASASGFSCDSTTWLLDEATPRDLTMCVARAAGIEVEK